MQKTIELLPVLMPNFLPVKGFTQRVSVGDLTESEAHEYAELMKQEFIKHWKKKKSNKIK